MIQFESNRVQSIKSPECLRAFSSEQQIRCLGGRGERLRLVGAGRLEHLRLLLVQIDRLRGRTVRLPVVRAGQSSDAELKARAQRIRFIRRQ